MKKKYNNSMKYQFSHLVLLYVEDDEIIRRNAVFYLKKHFRSVIEAENGIQALSLYREFQPDIIIADIKMPRLDGLGMAKKIREADRKIPIIITTAFTDSDILLQAVELQLTKYIVKPVNPEKLHLALNLAYEQIYQDKPEKIEIAPQITYDVQRMILTHADETIKLTRHELLLLELLIKNHRRVVTYSEIERKIWPDSVMSIDSLRSLVRFLRKKVPGIEIENISGVGYRLHL